MNETHFTEADRRLLTQLEERQTQTTRILEYIQVKLDSDTFVKRVDADVAHSLLDKKCADMESRLRWLERIGYSAVAILGAIQFYLNYFK